MTYTVLSGNIIRLSLERSEAVRLLGAKGSQQLMVRLLLKKVLSKLRLPTEGSFFARGVNNPVGGYDLYFTPQQNTSAEAPSTPYLLYFGSCNAALFAAMVLKQKLSDLEDCRFFRVENGYRLLIPASCSPAAAGLFEELSESVSKSRIEYAKTEEHGRELISHDALSVLAELY